MPFVFLRFEGVERSSGVRSGRRRQVWLRRWFDVGRESRYDVEVRDGENHVISDFSGSGFSQGAYPHVNVLEASRAVQAAVVEAIDKMVGVSVRNVDVHVEDVVYALDETA